MNAEKDPSDAAPESELDAPTAAEESPEGSAAPRPKRRRRRAAAGPGQGEARASARDGEEPGEDGAAEADPPSPRPLGGRILEVLLPIYDGTGRRYSWWDLLRDSYFTFDRRTLGFTRILLGFYLITDLIRRTWDWEDMFSTVGVLPNHVNLWRPGPGNFTLLNAFSTPGELWVLWGVMLATFVCLLVGFKTRLMQVLSLLWVVSLNGRVLLIENGGYVVQNLLLLWTCFLPLGDRFSVDSLRASLRRSRERDAADLNDRSTLADPDKPDRHVSVVGPVILFQLWIIYFFNVVHKTGPAWKNGTAVHYVLYVDRMVTPGVALAREYIPGFLLLFMTKTAMAFEAAIPVCLASPLGRVWARRLVVAMMSALHLAFGTTFVLGPFAWALCVWSTVLFGAEDWDIAHRTMRRLHRARVVRFDPAAPGALFFCRVLKRMDGLDLLTFEAAPGLGGKVAVRTPGGAEIEGAAALADIVAALPLGPTAAWALRLPGIRGAVGALLAAFDRRSAGHALGITVPAEAGVAPGPTPLRRGGRKVLAVLREATVLLMLAAAINQAGVELWAINRRIKLPQPEPLRTLALKFRFLQGWFMFSPNPVMDDGTIVVDAITVDGRHIDPFTGKEPNFDLKNAKSLGYNQIWSDYYNRIKLPANAVYREAMKEYMFRYPERTGRPEDAIVSGEVYWVKDWNPRWGKTESYGQEQEKLFSFANPNIQAQAEAEPVPPTIAPRHDAQAVPRGPSPNQTPPATTLP